MKKLFALMMVSGFAFAFVACGGKKEEAAATEPAATEEVAPAADTTAADTTAVAADSTAAAQ
jgi:hypothetical protein